MPISANSTQFNAKRLRLAIVCFCLLSVLALPLPALSTRIHLESDSAVATAGFFRLSWSQAEVADVDRLQYQLQSSSNPDFDQADTLYQGPDLARVISGKANGEYYYRIRALRDGAPATAWSDITHVTVEHHSFSRALMFFVAGAIIFFALLFFILTNHKSN